MAKSPYPSTSTRDVGRGAVSPLGGRSNPDRVLSGGGDSGPLSARPLGKKEPPLKPPRPRGGSLVG